MIEFFFIPIYFAPNSLRAASRVDILNRNKHGEIFEDATVACDAYRVFDMRKIENNSQVYIYTFSVILNIER